MLDYNKNKAYIYKFFAGQPIAKFNDAALKQVGALLARIYLQSQHFKSKIKKAKKGLEKYLIKVCKNYANQKVKPSKRI